MGEETAQQASDRAYNERMRGRSAFGNADPHPELGQDPGEARGGDWDSPPQQQADVSGAQPQQEASYGDPGEARGGSWASAYGGAPVAVPQQDAPAQPSPYTDRSAIGQHAARQGISFNDAADELQRVNASPGAGYRQTGPGQFEPVPGGPADPAANPALRVAPGSRMFQTGQNSGQLMPDTPENRLSDLNHTIQRIQLSQPEQMRAQALQQSMAGVDEAMHRGDLTPEDAGRLRQQIQAQGEQLWARQGSLPEMMMRQQFLTQQHAAAHQQAILAENASERAKRIEANTHTYADGTRLFIDDQGRPHFNAPRPDAAAAHVAAQQQKAWEAHEKLVERFHNEVRRDLQEARRSPRTGELAADTTSRRNPEWIQRLRQQGEGELTPEVIEARALRYRLNQHYGALHTQEPTQPGSQPAGGGSGAPGGAPGGQPTGPGAPRANPSVEESTAQLSRIREAAARGPSEAVRSQVHDITHDLQHLLTQHPQGVDSMPPWLQQQYRQRYAELSRLMNTSNPSQGQPGLGQRILNAPMNLTHSIFGG